MTNDLTLELARLIARDSRAQLLDAANVTVGEPVTLEEAVASGMAFWVRPRATLLVLDEDRTGDADEDQRRAAAIDTLVTAAEGAGVPHVLVNSGRPLNRHLYLAVGPTQAARVLSIILAEWALEQNLDVRDNGIRPPGSPHRQPGTAPATPVKGLAKARQELGRHTPSSAVAAMAQAVMGKRLSQATIDLVLSADGTNSTPGKTTSESRMSLANALFSIGSTRQALNRILSWGALAIGHTFRTRSETWRTKELNRLWNKATMYINERDEVGQTAMVRAWVNATHQAIWRGQTGGTDRAVLAAFGDLGLRVGRLEVGFSQGDIALAAGVMERTARRSLRRLEEAGWLCVAAEATPVAARVYQLTTPDGFLAREVPALHASPLSDLGSDVARWGALGKSTTALGRLLARNDATAGTIAKWLGVSIASVRHHLRKLAHAGLARRDDEGQWTLTASTDDVQALAKASGTFGARAHQLTALIQRRITRREALYAYAIEQHELYLQSQR